jgi:hypothetical protein
MFINEGINTERKMYRARKNERQKHKKNFRNNKKF